MRPGVRIYPVTGPPGAGKTTALLSLAEDLPWLARFGVRDYGMALAEAGHPLGLTMREALLRGELLSNRVVRLEFTHFLEHLPDGVQAVAVEGYPRDRSQSVDFFDVVRAAGARVAGLVVVDVPDHLVWTRVADRRICAVCGRALAKGAAPRCPTCAGPVVKRGDDEWDRVNARLKDFRQLSGEVTAYFAGQRLLRVIDGTSRQAEVLDALRELLASD
jgi:adenylate kinase